MTPDEMLRAVVAALEDLAIPYAIGGSIASVAYGEPRATFDIDIVIDIEETDVERLARSLDPSEFHLDEAQARAAVRTGGQFNVLVPRAGFKVDFFIATDDVERRQIEGRRRLPALPDLEATFSPPEELILKKLQYFAAGGSDKHLRDIASMLAISPDQLDVDDIARRAETLGLGEVWRVVGEPEDRGA
ncbi:MAG: hypothetical protein MJB57_14105 [Gemmatimonadetes bacterium]|nr:hypothetical protein [Gemmatimonadota bacterium]